MEPCRNSSRSLGDHAGTWAAATLAAGRAAVAGRSPEVVQAAVISATQRTAVRLMPSILRAPPARGFQLFVQCRQDLAGEALELRHLVLADEPHAQIGDAGLGVAAKR